MSAIQVPLTNWSAVWFSKNPTMCGPAASRASTRAGSKRSPSTLRRYVRGPSTSSTTPSARASGFSGTHIQPPDHAVAPPQVASFSATTTRRPCQAAVTAADRPAAPAPITSRSQSTRYTIPGRPRTGEPLFRTVRCQPTATAYRNHVECGSHCSSQRQSVLGPVLATPGSQAIPRPSSARPVIPLTIPPAQRSHRHEPSVAPSAYSRYSGVVSRPEPSSMHTSKGLTPRIQLSWSVAYPRSFFAKAASVLVAAASRAAVASDARRAFSPCHQASLLRGVTL